MFRMCDKINNLLKELESIESQLKSEGTYIPDPTDDYTHITIQRDKMTGNTKNVKKKMKNSQKIFLQSRIKQLRPLLRKKPTELDLSDNDDTVVYDI